MGGVCPLCAAARAAESCAVCPLTGMSTSRRVSAAQLLAADPSATPAAPKPVAEPMGVNKLSEDKGSGWLLAILHARRVL